MCDKTPERMEVEEALAHPYWLKKCNSCGDLLPYYMFIVKNGKVSPTCVVCDAAQESEAEYIDYPCGNIEEANRIVFSKRRDMWTVTHDLISDVTKYRNSDNVVIAVYHAWSGNLRIYHRPRERQ